MLKAVAAMAGALMALSIAGCVSSTREPPVTAAKRNTTLAGFPVMRTPPERVPAAVQYAIDRSLPALSGLPAQAIPTPIRSVRVWALANGQRVCLVSLERMGGMGLTCQPIAIARRDGVGITLIGRFERSVAQRVIIGIAPRDKGSAVATVLGRSSVRIPVTDGIFMGLDSELMPPDRLALVRSSSRAE